MNPFYSAFERALALCALVAATPVLAAAAVCIWLEDRGPILFRQQRVGLEGRLFRILKFRSMRTGAGGAQVTAASDRRITRTGAVLRRYKIDELPQLWNVVRGDMSLIGPRPEVPRYVQLEDPVWRKVLSVRPGISDWPTLAYRHEEELLAGAADPERFYREVVLPQKLALNIRYLEGRSLRRDARLLLLTARYSFAPRGFDPERIEQSFR
jgi:lipopolysaccharide/colanic/teichoic acid biosynthesis glycosyltransferase